MAPYAYRTTMEYSLPAETASGRYYWTNAYYWESIFSVPTADPSNNRIHLAQLNSVSEAVTCERWRIESAFGTGSYSTTVEIPTPGHISGMDRCLIIDAVRLGEVSGGSERWYKPLRGLLGPADVAGGLVSAEIIDWLNDVVLPGLALVPLVNHLRVPVGTLAVSPRVHGWQMRHGTLRSARRVLIPR
jgi:hypothetical protein